MMARYRLIGGKLRHVFGWRPEAGDHRYAGPVPKSMGAAYALTNSLPRRVDNSKLWPAIKDQGTIADCVENALCECYEYFQPLNQRLPLSRLYPYAYARLAEGTPLDEDAGSQVGTGLQVLTDRGSPYESDWDYSNYQQKFQQLPPASLDAEAAQHTVLFSYPCPDLFTLKASIAQGFPAAFGFRCPENMFSDECLKTGLIQYPAPNEGYEGAHCTGICGYDDDLKIGGETGAFHLPNSWGTSVGQDGFFWLPYRFVIEGIAASMYSVRRVVGAASLPKVAFSPASLIPPTVPPRPTLQAAGVA